MIADMNELRKEHDIKYGPDVMSELKTKKGYCARCHQQLKDETVRDVCSECHIDLSDLECW